MGKYLKLFNTHAEYTAFTQTEEFVKPNVSHCIAENEVHYNSVHNYIYIYNLNTWSTEYSNDGIAVIEDGMFSGRSDIQSVSLPKTVTSIGSEVFKNCQNLKAVAMLPETPPQIGSDVFLNSPDVKVFVKSESVNSYKNAWSAYADIIEAFPQPIENKVNGMPYLSFDTDDVLQRWDENDNLEEEISGHSYISITQIISEEGIGGDFNGLLHFVSNSGNVIDTQIGTTASIETDTDFGYKAIVVGECYMNPECGFNEFSDAGCAKLIERIENLGVEALSNTFILSNVIF